MEIALDLDGPLVDLAGGLLTLHGLDPNLKTKQVKWELIGIAGLPDTDEELWDPAFKLGRQFWAELKPTEHASQLVEIAGDSAYIITSPMHLQLGECVEGKSMWVKKWFPHLSERIVYVYNKGLVARPNTVLLDDKPANIQDWRANGGVGLLWPMPYNTSHTPNSQEDVVRQLRNFKRL